MTNSLYSKQRKHKSLSIIEYYLPFFLLLSQYKVGPFSIGIIGFGIITLLTLWKNKWKYGFSYAFKIFVPFIIYVLVRDVIKMFIGIDPIQTQFNRIIEYSVLILFVFGAIQFSFDEEKLYKSWKIAGIIFAIGFTYQLIQIYILHKNVSPISLIPGYSLHGESVGMQTRPSSFFSEPALFVSSMIPLVFLALKRKRVFVALITTVLILLTTSTVGVVLSAVLWLSYLVKNRRNIKNWITALLLIVVLIIAFTRLNIFDGALEKLHMVFEGGSTFGIRVTSAFEIARAEDPIELLIGSNYNEMGNFIMSRIASFSPDGAVLKYWHSINFAYTNTFGHLMLRYGLVGCVLFYYPFVKLLFSKHYQAKAYILLIIVASFGQSSLLNAHYFLNIALVLLYLKTQPTTLTIKGEANEQRQIACNSSVGSSIPLQG